MNYPYEGEELGAAEDGGPPGSDLDKWDAETAALDALEGEGESDYYDPDAPRKAVEKKRQEHAAAKLGKYGLTEKIEAETAMAVSVGVGVEPTTTGGYRGVTMDEPVGVSELYRLGEEEAAEVLHRVSGALEELPPDRQEEEVYHNLRDRAIKSLQGAKGSRRAAEAFVDRHLPEPLGEHSPYTRDGLRDADILALEPPAFLVPGLFPEGEVGILTGDSGTGKSWLTAELACAVGFGGSWLGTPAEQTGHVRLFLPEGRAGYPPRLAGLLIRRGILEPGTDRAELADALEGRVSITGGDTRLGDPRLEEHLISDVEEHGTRLAIFDTLNRSLADGLSENDTDDAKRVVNMLHRVAAATGVTILLIHHPPHGESRERGSKVWRQATDFRFLIYGSDKDARQGKPLTLWNVKQRNTRPADDIGYRLVERPLSYDGEATTTVELERAKPTQEVPIADRIREYVAANPGARKGDVYHKVRGRTEELRTAIEGLTGDGFLEDRGGGAGAALHVAGEWAAAEEEFPADLDKSIRGESAGDDQ